MNLKHPFLISARLLPAVCVGDATISIEYAGSKRPAVIEDVRSGVGRASLRDGMSALLSFLYAAATQSDMKGEFPPRVEEWAKQHSEEISMCQLEIDETPDCCVE